MNLSNLPDWKIAKVETSDLAGLQPTASRRPFDRRAERHGGAPQKGDHPRATAAA
jgi:hypothetical protein